MKYITMLIVLVAFAKAEFTQAQQLSGVATYQTQRSVDIKLDSTSGMNSEMQKSIQEQLRKQFQKEFKLTFDMEQAHWKEDESISKPSAPSSGMVIMVSSNKEVRYHNIKAQSYTRQSDLMGKLFLIEDTLEKPEWQLVKETKNIGQYTCFKAVWSREVEQETFNDSSDEIIKEKKIVETTAWYTLDIPVSHGPDRFWGLPGLILEVNDGKMAMMCTKVVLNPKEAITIEAPTKGKKVTQAEYEDIATEKSKEMMDRFHNKKSKKGASSSFSIKIGG